MNHRMLPSLLLASLVAALSAHLVARVALAAAPLGDAPGLLGLYLETAVIAVGLAALRVRALEARSARSPSTLAMPLPRPSGVTPRASAADLHGHRPDKSAA
jgi:hypothetical protein